MHCSDSFFLDYGIRIELILRLFLVSAATKTPEIDLFWSCKRNSFKWKLESHFGEQLWFHKSVNMTVSLWVSAEIPRKQFSYFDTEDLGRQDLSQELHDICNSLYNAWGMWCVSGSLVGTLRKSFRRKFV